MNTTRSLVCCLACLTVFSLPAAAREWTDSTGKYTTDADLVAFNAETVVLKKENRKLVAVPMDKLSTADQLFLQSKETHELLQGHASQQHTWTFRSGMKVIGHVVDYARKDVVIQRRLAKMYVNDKLFDNLPEIYQRMVPQIVAHFEKQPIEDRKALEAWLLKQGAEPRRFTCDGVMLELENGDMYGVPFFLFCDEDLKILQPGWDKWLAAENDAAQRRQHALFVESRAKAYQQDREFNHEIAIWNSVKDWVDLWEVQLLPRPGVNATPQVVVIPARNSLQAQTIAVEKYPQYRPGIVRQIDRRY